MKGVIFEKQIFERFQNIGMDNYTDFAKLFENEALKQKNYEDGKVYEGTVISIGKDNVMVDIGYKSEGIIPLEEFWDDRKHVTVKPGDVIHVYLDATEDDHGNLILSKEKADKMKIWDKIAFCYENDQLIEGKITERVKGGLSVDIGVKAFLPGSQIDLAPVRNLDGLLNKNYDFKIIKFNKKRGNIVLSRRALLEKERATLRTKTLEQIVEGEVLPGIVKNITEYGAFIDLGGIDGLLHITDISWGRINHPSEVFGVGDKVNVKILKYDKTQERVSLGMKQISPDPWIEARKKYTKGAKVNGKIVSITDYGAFVELEEGVEGLIHISEMSWVKRVKHPSKMVAIGDVVDVMVLDIDQDKRRISLGMKQLEPNPWDLIEEKYPAGTIVKGKIRNLTEFGIFIGIEDGIDGLVHISDISWMKKFKHPSEMYKKGDEIEAKVLSIDKENERFSLGIKQLESDPWDAVREKYNTGSFVVAAITKFSDSVIFLETEDGIDCILNGSEQKEAKFREKYPELKETLQLSARVVELDQKERKLRISVLEYLNNEEKADYENYMAKSQGAEQKARLGDLLKDKSEK